MKLFLLTVVTLLLLHEGFAMGNNNRRNNNNNNNRGGSSRENDNNGGNNNKNNNGNNNGNNNNNNKKQKAQKVTFYPCKTTILEAEHTIGGNPNKQRIWNGQLDLTAVEASRIIVTMIFDIPVNVILDPLDGERLKGSKGNYVRFVVFPGHETLNFTVKGKNKNSDTNPLVPNVLSININDKEVCEGAKKWDDRAQFVAVRPPQRPNGSTHQHSDTDPVLQPMITTTTAPPKAESHCGVRQLEKQAYVTNGYASTPGDWPWHAAMYHKSSRTLSYKCGGTLISESVVVSAAHCLWDMGAPIIPERVIIQLGKYNLQFNDVNTLEVQVYDIKMHEKYSNYDFNDDIALLKLSQQVTYTRYIQPCCLWPKNKVALDNVVNKKGFVVGWGLQEDDDLADTLTEATMPIVDIFTCLNSNRDFFGPVLSDFNYCAGYQNGTAVCNGDSGGGMFFSENGVWYLRGIVSFSSVREDRNVCNPLQFVVFTDLAKYLPWIAENM